MTDDIEKLSEELNDTVEDALGKERHFVTALARGLELLRCFKLGERFLGNQELAKRTGLPKPTVSRLTHTLTKLGYLNHSENMGKYSLGSAVLSLGYSFLGTMNIRQLARPIMQELADYAQASVAIGVRDRLEMVYIENSRSSATSFTVHLDVGSHVPLATTAIGRAYLCGISDMARSHLLDQIRLRNVNDWPKIKAGADQALKDYQDRGFCISAGDWQKDVHAVAVPYFPADGSDILAFNCGGPAFQLRRHMLEDDIGPHLVALVKNVQASALRNQ